MNKANTRTIELDSIIEQGRFIEKYGSINDERVLLRQLKSNLDNEECKRLYATILFLSPEVVFVDGEFSETDAYSILLNYYCNAKGGYTKYIYQYLMLYRNWMSYCSDFNDIDTNLEWISGAKERSYMADLINAVLEGVEFPRGIIQLMKRIFLYYGEEDEYQKFLKNAVLSEYKEAIIFYSYEESTPLEQKELLIERCIKDNYPPAYRALATISSGSDIIKNLEIAYSLGDARSLLAMANLYLYGVHVKKDMHKAFELNYIAATRYNNPQAYINLAIAQENEEETNHYYYKAFQCFAEKEHFPPHIQENYKECKYMIVYKEKMRLYGKPSNELMEHIVDNTSWLIDYFPKGNMNIKNENFYYYCSGIVKIKLSEFLVSEKIIDYYLDYEIDYYNNCIRFFLDDKEIGEHRIKDEKELSLVSEYLDNPNKYSALIRPSITIKEGELIAYVALYNNKDTKVQKNFHYNEVEMVLV